MASSPVCLTIQSTLFPIELYSVEASNGAVRAGTAQVLALFLVKHKKQSTSPAEAARTAVSSGASQC